MYRAAINKVGISFFFLEGNKKCDSQTNEIETARARENIIDTKFMTVHLIQRYSKRTSTNVNNTHEHEHDRDRSKDIIFNKIQDMVIEMKLTTQHSTAHDRSN